MSDSKLLEVVNLHATIGDVEILKGVNLSIKAGEIHAIMGPNGSGKSTFSKILAGHPSYKITEGQIFFKGEEISELDPDVRSHKGIFLRLAYNSKQKALNKNELDPIQFLETIQEKLKIIKLDTTFLSRNVNEGFSGGEKKRNEILQFAILDSDLGILDETDSGLDIDALKTISEAINKLMSENKSIILITHYKRLLDYIKPDFIHVMKNGKVIKTSDASFADLLEEKGYEWLV